MSNTLKDKVAERAVEPAGTTGETMAQMIERQRDQIERALPKLISPDRFVRVVLTQFRTTPRLLECSQASILGTVMRSAQLGLELEPQLGHAYMVPYEDHKSGIVHCTFQIGYKGYIDLARRSGQIKQIVARTVREADQFKVWTDENGDHLYYERSPEEDRGDILRYYGLATFVNGGSHVEVMSIPEIEKRRDRSPSARARSGPWVTDYEAMCKKTVIRAMVPWLPLTPEVATLTGADEAVVMQHGSDQVVEFIEPREQLTVTTGAIDASSSDRVEAEQALTEILESMTPAEKQACSSELLSRFGPVAECTLAQLKAAVDLAAGWPDSAQTPPAAPEAAPDGDPGWQPPEDAPLPLGATLDLQASTAAAIATWPVGTVREQSRAWGVPMTDEAGQTVPVGKLRTDLIQVLAEARAQGNPTAAELF